MFDGSPNKIDLQTISLSAASLDLSKIPLKSPKADKDSAARRNIGLSYKTDMDKNMSDISSRSKALARLKTSNNSAISSAIAASSARSIFAANLAAFPEPRRPRTVWVFD